MKRICLILTVITVLIIILVPFTARAEDSVSGIYNDIDTLLDENDIGIDTAEVADLSPSRLYSAIKEKLTDIVTTPVKTLLMLLTVTVMVSLLRSCCEDLAGGTNSDIYSMVCVIAAVSAAAPELLAVYEDSLTAIRKTGAFISVFVPSLSGLTAACGGIMSSGAYNLMILAASEIIVSLTNSYFMPLISIMSALSISSSVFGDTSLESIVSLIKKLMTWGMTISMTLFTGFVTLKCSLAGKTDTAASKAVKYAISGFVPIVGSAVTDAYSTVRSSFEVIRCTVGTAGTTAIILIMLPLVLKIVIYRGIMWIGAAAAELFTVEPLKKLLSSLDSCLAIAQSVLICYAVMFILCTGILMNCINI